ncbi:hypothetical protein [Halomontanus rarus]|uniref:hypothetical protein n=1 Tax=Halomontanus rarus TaxID=3034020 RepID=UPI001A9A11D6
MEVGTSYFGVRDVRHVVDDLERFDDEGLNAVLHTFSERDKYFYEETMAEIVAASNDRGFTTYVNPWGVGKVFGGEAFSEFLAKHPDSRQQTVTGERQHGACINDPEFRAAMREWTEAAAGLNPDVLFWDEPHWLIPDWFYDGQPDDAWVCRCSHCREKYETQHGRPMPAREDETIRRFREDSLLEFLSEMMELAAQEDVRNAVCLVPETDAEHGIRNWDRLAADEHLDTLSTDPYWEPSDVDDVEKFVAETTAHVVTLAEEYDLQSQIWIQGFGLSDEPKSYDNVETATRTAIEGGADSVFMWGWDGCRAISSIASENPDTVWQTYIDAAGE